MSGNRRGFTIVELLIVIVVIGILASVTIVAFNGVQNRAKATAIQSGLAQVKRKVDVYWVANGNVYPATLADASVSPSGSDQVTYQYSVNTSVTPNTYCVSGAIGSIVYSITGTSSQAVQSPCVTPAGSVVASGDNPPSETIAKLFDGTSATKWLTFSTTGWVIFSITSASTVSTYTVTSANDSPDRDPKAWTLYGSNDRVAWTPIDSRSGEVFASRYQAKTYTIASPGMFAHYKFNITQNSGNLSATQVSELTLTGVSVVP